MTIKQQGGVFGRNPSFNNVDVETLDVSGATSVGGSLSATNITDNGNTRIIGNTTGTDYNNGSLIIGEDAVGATVVTVGNNAAGNYSYMQAVKIGNQYNTLILNPNGGAVTVGNGNLVFSDGKGIDFSATSGTGTSELFDDYEEGTFTPTVIGQTTPGTGTYTRNVGFYTKIGDRVIFTIAIDMTAHTGSGNMRLAGLPFTASSVSGDLSYFDAAASNLTYSGQLKAYVSGGSTEAAFLSMASGTSLSAVALDTSCELRLTGVYRSV